MTAFFSFYMTNVIFCLVAGLVGIQCWSCRCCLCWCLVYPWLSLSTSQCSALWDSLRASALQGSYSLSTSSVSKSNFFFLNLLSDKLSTSLDFWVQVRFIQPGIGTFLSLDCQWWLAYDSSVLSACPLSWSKAPHW